MNFFQYIRGAWGSTKAYTILQTQSYVRIVSITLAWIVLLSVLHTAAVYRSVQHVVENVIPNIAAQFPEDVVFSISKGVMTSNATTTIPLFSIDAMSVYADTSRAMDQIDAVFPNPTVFIVQDGIVLLQEKNIEKITYPKQDLTITKKGVQEWSSMTQTLIPWLIGVVLLFLSISNSFMALLLSIFFMFVVRLYLRTQGIISTYTASYKIGIYVLIPVMTVITSLYIVFGFTSFMVASTVGFLSLYYGLRK